jgi:hypothetical protein
MFFFFCFRWVTELSFHSHKLSPALRHHLVSDLNNIAFLLMTIWAGCHNSLNMRIYIPAFCVTSSPLQARAVTQAVNHRLPTAAARVRYQVRSCGTCGGQSGTGARFLRILWFPLPICITLIAPHWSASFIWGWYNRANSGRRTKWTQSQPIARKPTN